MVKLVKFIESLHAVLLIEVEGVKSVFLQAIFLCANQVSVVPEFLLSSVCDGPKLLAFLGCEFQFFDEKSDAQGLNTIFAHEWLLFSVLACFVMALRNGAGAKAGPQKAG